eukprot:41131-Eustigmatos_ZCMA.PRE.1
MADNASLVVLKVQTSDKQQILQVYELSAGGVVRAGVIGIHHHDGVEVLVVRVVQLNLWRVVELPCVRIGITEERGRRMTCGYNARCAA